MTDISAEIKFKTARSGGKGGQNVNKVETRVEGYWSVENSALITEAQKILVKEKLANKITAEGFLLVKSQTERNQLGNKMEVIKKMNQMVTRALIIPKKRKKTALPVKAREKRLDSKKKTAELKVNRKKIAASLLTLILSLFLNLAPAQGTGLKTGMVKFTFRLTVNGHPLVLNDSLYSNVFGESYRVSKFKFYVSHPGLKNLSVAQTEKNGFHLIDATQPVSQSFSFATKAGQYNEFFFLLGVDSARNCSGAQTGALDPLNDMFWTWNSGYVMIKMEGISALSSAINNRLEYHIGGYKGADQVLQKIKLLLPSPITISPEMITELIIETDINKWWNTSDPLTIKDNPICTTPGHLAKKISLNYRNMFSVGSNTVDK